MANNAIKQMIFKQLFEKGAANARAKKIAEMAPELIGQQAGVKDVEVPYQQSPQEMFPGEQPLPGLMNIEQQDTPATGLFNMDMSDTKRNIAFNQRLLASGMPSLQKQAVKNLSDMGNISEGGGAPDYLGTRTFAVGAENGQMQRARLTPDGGFKTLGEPYDPRNPFLNTGTEFVNPNQPQDNVAIENKQKAKDIADGTSEITRRDEQLKLTEKSIDNFNESLGLYDEAVTALDQGASVGYMQRYVPSMRESTLKLQNVANRLGLNIIKSVTFGSLSEAEMDKAMQTGLPTNMQGEALKNWLIEKKAAVTKLRNELIRYGQFIEQGGTKIQWEAQNKKPKQSAMEAADSILGL